MDFSSMAMWFSKLSVQLEGQVGIPIALALLMAFLVIDRLILGRLTLFRYPIVGVVALLLFVWLLLLFGPGSYNHYLKSYANSGTPVVIPIKITNASALTSTPFPGMSTQASEQSYDSVGTTKRQQQAIVFCLDVSGSMGSNPYLGKSDNPYPTWTTGNDPERLSFFAGHMFTDLASPGQQVGAVFFAGKVIKVIPLTKIDPLQSTGKSQLKQAIDVPYKGGTDVEAGILAAVQMLDGLDKTYGKYLILQSDMEPDENNKKIPENIRDLLRQKGISAFAIGLGNRIDLEQMRRLTWEEPYQVTEAKELPNVFKEILGKIWDTREIPQTQNTDGDFLFQEFLPIAKEVNFIVFDHDIGNLGVQLIKPDGTPISEKEFATPGNYIGAEGKYRVFKIKSPQRYGKGRWTLKVNRNPDQVSSMQVLDLAIDAHLSFNFKNRQIQASQVRLVNIADGSTYKNPDFYAQGGKFELVIQLAGQKEMVFNLASGTPDPLVFAGDGQFEDPGSYQFFVRFENALTAIRSEIFTFAYTETNTVTLAGKPGPVRLPAGSSANLVLQPTPDSNIQAGRLQFKPDFNGLSGIARTGNNLTIGAGSDKNQVALEAARFGLGQKPSTGGEFLVPVSLHGEKSFDLPLSVKVVPAAGDFVNLILFLVFEGACALLALAVLYKLLSGKYFPANVMVLKPKINDKGRHLPNTWFWPWNSTFSKPRFRLTPGGRSSAKRQYWAKNSSKDEGDHKESFGLPDRRNYASDSFSCGQVSYEYGFVRSSVGKHQFWKHCGTFASKKNPPRSPF